MKVANHWRRFNKEKTKIKKISNTKNWIQENSLKEKKIWNYILTDHTMYLKTAIQNNQHQDII